MQKETEEIIFLKGLFNFMYGEKAARGELLFYWVLLTSNIFFKTIYLVFFVAVTNILFQEHSYKENSDDDYFSPKKKIKKQLFSETVSFSSCFSFFMLFTAAMSHFCNAQHSPLSIFL